MIPRLACGQPHTSALCPPPVLAGRMPEPSRVPSDTEPGVVRCAPVRAEDRAWAMRLLGRAG